MEAVHNHTSTANQMEHQIFPNNHISKTSLMAENGRTMMPSVKSAQAKETIEKKRYVMVSTYDYTWYDCNIFATMTATMVTIEKRKGLKSVKISQKKLPKKNS